MGIIHSRASKQRDKAQAQLLNQQRQVTEQAARQQRWAVYEQAKLPQPQPGQPAAIQVANGSVYLMPRSSPLVLTPAEAMWLANAVHAAAVAPPQ